MEVKKTDDGNVLEFSTVRRPPGEDASPKTAPLPDMNYGAEMPTTLEGLKAEVFRLRAYASQVGGLNRAGTEALEQQNQIVEYLRDNYQREIAEGRHSGMRFGDVITGYLAQERIYRKWNPFRLFLWALAGRK